MAVVKRICIIGSGPGGFYTAAHLLTKSSSAAAAVHIDMYERLPVPYGLVRYGVAPDHADVKNVIHKFTQLVQDHRHQFRFIGNMGPGFPLPIDVLRRAYDAVVLAYGFSSQDRDHDRMLGLDLESRTANVVSARDFVGWYNGYPLEEEGGGIGGDATTHTTSAATSLNLLRHHRYRLDQTRHVAIVGMGNVALDIARILLSRPSPLSTTDIDSLDLLSTTDISHEALDMLRKSRVEHVSILGRRGPLEAAFTTKEFKQLLNKPQESLNFYINRRLVRETARDPATIARLKPIDMRPRKRLMDALVKACDVAAGDLSDIPWSPPTSSSSSITPRSWSLHFNSVPKSLVFTVPQSSSSPHTTAVNFTTSSDDSNNLDLVAKGLEVINRNSSATSISSDSSTAATLIPADLIIKSIGYSAEHYPGLSLLLNQQGAKSSSSSASLSPPTSPLTHIQNTNGRVAPGVYVAGWLKRGPVGVIASTMHDAYATATTLLSDLQLDSSQSQSSQSSSESLTPTFEEKPGFALIEPILRERGINWCSYDEWLRIDTEEVHRGGLLGKPREKITSVKEMITIAKQKNM